METEFNLKSADFGGFSDDEQVAILNWLRNFEYEKYFDGMDQLNTEIKAVIEDQKNKGYAESEILPVRIFSVGAVDITHIHLDIYALVRIPYTVERIPEGYSYYTTIDINYNSPRYDKKTNSLGAAVKQIMLAREDKRAAARAEKDERDRALNDERAAIRAANDAKKAEEKARREAKEATEKAFIRDWVLLSGSDRLKLAQKLRVPFSDLFKLEWSKAMFGDSVRIFLDNDELEEFIPDVPELEQLQKYEAAKLTAASIKEFSVSVDLAEIRIKTDDPFSEGSTDLAIIYKVDSAWLEMFWVVDFI